MNQNKVISTAVLFLLLGTTIPAFAQKGQEEKGGGAEKAQPQRAEKAQPQRAQKAQPQRAQKAQPQRAEKVQPQRAEKAQPQRAQQVQRQQRPQAIASNRGHYGRIPDDHYRAHFGHDHSFHMGRPQMIGGYNRFQYGGYWFGFNEGWPVGWDYNDDCYVVYEGGAYYMFNLRHPGIRITLNLF